VDKERTLSARGDAPLAPERAPTLIQTAFPTQGTAVFVAAIVTGVVFIAMTTVFRSYFAVNGLQANLILCIGAALVLAAFGGQATVRVGGFITAGVGALAIGLFGYLEHSSRYLSLQGRIEGFDFEAYESLSISQKNEMLGRIRQRDSDPKRSRYDFVIFKDEIDGEFLNVDLTYRGTNKERTLRVPTADIEWAFGGRRRLEWEFREDRDAPESVLLLFDLAKGRILAREGETGTSRFASVVTDPSLIGAAFAQETADLDVPAMLERLKADDSATRRAARDALSNAPIDAVPLLMERLRRDGWDYRVKLGICVALTGILRADKSRSQAVSSKLTDDDLDLLLDIAGDPDRTVRIYASEFLFDLGDTRVTKLAIPRAARTSDDNARYNLLLISQDGWRKLSSQEKAALAVPLNEAKAHSGEKTLKLFEKLHM